MSIRLLKGKFRVIAVIPVIVAVMVLLTGCPNAGIRDIPAGYVGKLLTPTGWDSKIIEAGQIDVGAPNANGQYTSLVLLEATSTTVKEQFGKATEGEDHRVMTKNGTPLAVDVYIRAIVPEGEKERNGIFSQVTPALNEKDFRVRTITLRMIYERFAQMDVRGSIRSVFTAYDDSKDVYNNYDAINKEISRRILAIFEANKVPLMLQNCQISNVKPDEKIWDAENKKVAADAEVEAINKIGEALRRNPEYGEFMKWKSLENIAATGSASGTNTIIIIDGSEGEGWAQAEYAKKGSTKSAAPPAEEKK